MDTLKVTYFGRFSLNWNGTEIVPGRNTSSKFLRLLQIVWMYHEDGVSRHRLLELLYPDAELTNPDNSLNNLIFQMRRQMAAAGLPKRNYIVLRNHKYYPDPEVPLQIDLWEFRTSILMARRAESSQEKEICYLHALECCQGAVLPESGTQSWVAAEAAKVSEEYAEACRYVGGRAGARGDYQGMSDIYEKAALYFPDQARQAEQPDSPVDESGSPDTFIVQITGRENSTWQGEVICARENRKVRFQSAMDLLRFIDASMISAGKDAPASDCRNVERT